jgi:hypothetical protein
VCQAVRAPGLKWTLAAPSRERAVGVAIVSMKTVPVNQSVGPAFVSNEFLVICISFLLVWKFSGPSEQQDSAVERREIEGAERIDLLRDTFLIGLPPDHRLSAGSGPLKLAQLAVEDWILPSVEGFLAQACRQAGFEPRPIATTPDPVATHGMIARGLGVGWIPGLLADGQADIVVRPVKGDIPTRDVYALLPPGDRHPLTAKLIAALTGTARDFSGTSPKIRH